MVPKSWDGLFRYSLRKSPLLELLSLEYRASIDRLLSLVDHERTVVSTSRQPQARQKEIFNLERTEALLSCLGDPHLKARTVHVAGTKGKGSTAALCDSALHAAGFRTGFYSSPHLHSFCERLRLDTKPNTVMIPLLIAMYPMG